MTLQLPQNIYGYDLVCTIDLAPDAAECGGIVVLGNALFRRASTPRGGLAIYDPNYGYDLGQFLNEDLDSATDLAPIGAGLDAEFLKDPRVAASQTVVSYVVGSDNLGQLTTSTKVIPANGPSFKLVLGVSAIDGQVQILNISPT